MSTPAPADSSLQSDERIDVAPKAELERLGNSTQCPICGSDVHEDAYHCTKCRSFFCYHCRAHLGAEETILQCSNRDCSYYGKWLCSVCNPVAKQQQDPLEYLEPLDGYWPAWLLLSLLASLVFGFYFTWSSAFILFVGLYAGIGYILQSMDVNIFGKQRKVSMDRSTDVHLCICCNKPSKKTGLRQRAG